MIVVGLTGSIAMGKSETARMFASLGVPVFDSDAAVHALYAKGGVAVEPVSEAFPGTVRDGAIDRTLLTAQLGEEPTRFAKLEGIVHPLVRTEQDRFLAVQREAGAAIAVLDIPLLFETGRDREVDCIVVVSAPPGIQRRRVLARPGMTPEKFERILSRQMPDEEKRARADFVVDTSQGLDHALAQVRDIADHLEARTKRHA